MTKKSFNNSIINSSDNPRDTAANSDGRRQANNAGRFDVPNEHSTNPATNYTAVSAHPVEFGGDPTKYAASDATANSTGKTNINYNGWKRSNFSLVILKLEFTPFSKIKREISELH